MFRCCWGRGTVRVDVAFAAAAVVEVERFAFEGLAGMGSWVVLLFGSEVLKGERGRVRELWDLGERIALRAALDGAVVAAALGFVAVGLARFLGFARS